MFPDDDFVVFENHTTGIGSKLLKKMEGKGLGINVQGIVNLIKVEELPYQIGLGYVGKEVGECAKIDSKPPLIDDEKPSSVLSKLTEEVKDVDFLSVSYSDSMISVGDLEIPITGTNMRLLTRMRYKEEKELGVNNHGITQPFEVVERPQFIGLGYTEGECSKLQILPRHRQNRRGKRMMGTYPHHPMEVPIARKELRQSLIAIMTLETKRKGITSHDIRMFILIIIMLLIMNVKHGIKNMYLLWIT